MTLLRSLLDRFWRKPPATSRRAVLEECEPRVLYAADLHPALWGGDDGTAVVRLADSDDADRAAVTQGPEIVTVAGRSEAAESAATLVEPGAQPGGQNREQSGQTRELVVVDPSVHDHQAFVDDLLAQQDGPRRYEVVVLDADRDGLAQLTELLAERDGIDALHIVSHGDPGSFHLATSRVDASMLGQHEADVRAWARAFTPEADILIYGCDVAATPDGQVLLEVLAGLSGADVAASIDPTGHSLLAGDWELEVAAGSVETAVALGVDLQQSWVGVLSAVPVGSEFTVNSTTNGVQRDGVTAMDADGNFVVVWTSNQGGTLDIYARRFNAEGVAQGNNFLVNTTTANAQESPAVAMDAAGNFVVVWAGHGPDDSNGVYGQRYNAAGVAQGSEFLINTTTANAQASPAVAMDADGNFVVTWQSSGQDAGSTDGIYAQRFAADGTTMGTEFGVNSTTANHQRNPDIAMNAAGFVIVWQGNGPDDSNDVFGQRYNAAGVAQGGEFRVNSTTSSNQIDAAVAMDAAGNFVVVWHGNGPGDSNIGIFMQRYNASGDTQGVETRVNNTVDGDQYYADVAMNASGGFVVAFTSWASSPERDIYVREYDASGTPLAVEGRVNSSTDDNQEFPSIATDGSGRFIVVWTHRVDSSSNANDVYGRRVRSAQNAAPVNTMPVNQYTAVSTNRVFSSSNGNQISIADADAGTNPVRVTLSVTNGALTLNGTTGLSFTTGDGTTDPTMTFTGTLTNINAALNGMAFAPTAGYRGLAQLTLVTNDQGNTGPGGAKSDTDSIAIHVGALVVTTTSNASNGTVTSVANLIANDGGDGISLFEAIQATNATAGTDYIHFDIADPGPHVINVTTALPTITQAVVIDASSEPDFAANGNRPVVVLDGNDLAADGLTLGSGADGSTIRGLVIRDFGHSGIYIRSGSDGNTIAGNYIGRLTTSGTAAAAGEGNGAAAIWIEGSSNTIGGIGALDRNILSGNAGAGVGFGGGSNNAIQGNYIGVDASGATALGNASQGIFVDSATNNIIGGVVPAARNVISGNLSYGIWLTASASGTRIQGNLVGLNAAGSAALANVEGVYVQSADNLIGGTAPAQRNVVSGNIGRGITLTGAMATNNRVQGNYVGTDETGMLDVDGTDPAMTHSGVVLMGGASNNLIGTDADGVNDAAERNVISGNNWYGVDLVDVSNNRVQGNYIGTDATGNVALGNSAGGVSFWNHASGNFVGNGLAAARNVIAGNGSAGQGQNVNFGLGVTGNKVQGNYIGLGANGNTTFGTLIGVRFGDGDDPAPVTDNLVGTDGDGSNDADEGNIIAGHTWGIELSDAATSGNRIAGNFIGTDVTGMLGRGNTSAGIRIIDGATGNTIGGATAIEGNLIAANGAGILIDGEASDANIARNNRIGVNAGGGALANGGNGVSVRNGADDSVLSDNWIAGNGAAGIAIDGPSSGTVIRGNRIGTDSAGTAALGNAGDGIRVAGGASNTTIGGTAAQRNIISGNTGNGVAIDGANDNRVSGNYIGTTATGDGALANAEAGVVIRSASTGNTIGTDLDGMDDLLEGNVIAGNAQDGVAIQDSGSDLNKVAGNVIGLGIDASTVVPNGLHGVRITGGASDNVIGGTSAEARNVISGNDDFGVLIGGSNSSGNQVLNNFIGTDGTGELARANLDGIVIDNAPANVVGQGGAGNVVAGNTYYGIWVDGAGSIGNVIQANKIGIDVTGTTAVPNGAHGVLVAAGASATRVGGSGAGEGNLISGNAGVGVAIWDQTTAGTLVEGNRIGTNSAGTAAIGNGQDGVRIADSGGNTIGGTMAGTRNVISGNDGNGVQITGANASGNVVQGNYIGVNATGTAALGNAWFGVRVTDGADDTEIGGSAAGAGNVIAGNGFDGVRIDGTGTDRAIVRGNVIGLNATGTAALANGDDGIEVNGSGSVHVIGGTTAAERNVVSGNSGNGVAIRGTSVTGVVVSGNYIGTGQTGIAPLGNAGFGVHIEAESNTLGGETIGAGNLISGNTRGGVEIVGNDNVVVGNLIGVDAAGTLALANGGPGVLVTNGGTGNRIGSVSGGVRNRIANNSGPGVAVTQNSTGNAILGSEIYANGGLGIDLGDVGVTANDVRDTDSGPNRLQNFPVLDSAQPSGANLAIVGSLHSAPGTTYRVEFYASATGDASGHGQARTWLGHTTVTTDAAGDATFSAVVGTAPVGHAITATATEDLGGGTYGDTSEFAANVTVSNPPVITSDGGGATASVNAAENQTAVTTVTATDPDAGASLTYSISGGADAALFTIDASTGALSFSTAPDFETPTDAGADNVYDVIVEVSDGLGGTDTQAIAVTVTNVNEAPAITSDGGGATASINVVENQTAVTTVTASDPDAGTTLTYSVTGGADAALFTIDADTGVLSFNAAPDFETPTDAGADNVYDVTVEVSDGLGGTDTQAIALTVTNVNEAPVITSDGGGAAASINAAENQTAVTTVTATDPDAGATLTYLISGGADSNLFTIDSLTGVLSFSTAPDFETPTDSGSDNVYDVTVRVSDGLGGIDTQAIAVTVTDVNEAPVITSDGGGATASVNAAENQTAVTTVTATDPDAGASLTYSISGGGDSSLFTIDSSTGALSFNAAPDFETPTDADADNIYAVTVQVSDGLGTTDTQAIAVTVTNVNEAPVITSDGGGASASVNVAENQTAVTTVTATDPDAGASLAYSITGGADASLFTIDASTGVLSFNTTPDFETPTDSDSDTVYDVTVQVSDGLGGTGTQAIAVTVANVNEAPAITSDGGGATASVNAAENQTAVTTVTATDPDAGTVLTYSITGGTDASLFTIDASTGVLSFNAAPDFETPTDAGADNVYDVTVEVSDGLGGTDTQAIAVTVTNVNEAPAITSDGGGVTASIDAAENQTAVTTVTATDPDAGASLTYSITGGADAALFTIDASTGALSFSTAPDFEAPTDADADNFYDVTVEVSDGLGGTDTQAIAITVINVNEAPVITSDGGGAAASVNAAENQTAVTTITATDPDAGASLTYLITGGADAALFTIDASTGVLSFNAAPDFETPTDVGVDNVYDVTIEVSDGLGGIDTQTIAVTVTNVNEAPVITSDGGGASASVNAAENQTAVTTVTATDPDAGATLTYSITSGADASLFTINASTGVLSFNTAPDFETPTDSGADNVYDVTVQVSDGLGGIDTQAIAVTVTNVNEVPVITSDGGGVAASVNAAENQTAVTTVTATDPDAGTTLTYSISGGADSSLFTIDSSTGVLSFSTAPDFETPTDSGSDNVYDVTVEVSDGLGGIDTQAISVTVTNVNEAPVTTSDGGGATASVNAAENQTAVTTVTATDPDAGASLTYSITGGADAALFTIDASTGVLSFSTAPDFETPIDSGADNVYDVTVQVSDGLGGTDTQAIAVTVTNVNEAPVITSDGGGATASINAAENQTAVTTVTASDPDAGTTLTYSIMGGADATLFTIDSLTGVLSLNTAPNFETPTDSNSDNIYDVTVEVSDGLGGTDTQAIAVTVTNVNEAPVIISDGGDVTASINAAENQTAVTTVTATDPDAGATLTYSITGGVDASLFTIDSSTGVLSFSTAPDFETPTDSNGDNVYDVTVQVSDGLGGIDTQAIAITVTNVNEAPAITSDGGGVTASVNVVENQAAVTTVTATDPDAGTVLTYSITGGADAALFTIDASTGVLWFNAAPDFETPTDVGADNVYDVTVEVSDGLGGIDTQAIAVTVTNVNEAPVITSDGGGASASVNAAENQTAVTTVTATDPDAGTTLTYSITGGADAARFTINASTGVLSFNIAPDFETPTDVGADNVYDVTVEVSDGLGGTDTQAIAVTVTNVNEAPVIISDGGGVTASINAAENQTAVTTVTATDPDAGATLTYSITSGADASLFTINASTGALSFSTAPDFETPTDAGADNVYDVTVQVSDGLGGIDTQAIAVTVTNVNEAPVITSDGGGVVASINATENQTAVTTVTATDPDAGATLTYSISGGADAALFMIDADTGVLSFNAASDFETPADGGADNVYDVTVQVSDGLGGTDTQAIAVTVTDVNEAPIITSDGGGATASVNAAENQTAVTTVTATDPDAGTTLTYSIMGGADASLFTIDSSTGVLSFSTAPDFETPTDSGSDNAYDVTVQVSDGLGGIDTQAIAVTVTDVNEAPVIISGGGATASVNAAENQTVVTTVTATDPDAGASLTYSISGGADAALFTIDASTGVLSFSTAPDFETPVDVGADNVYDVTVQVSDGLGGTDTQAISVTVTNVNEAPVITSDGGGATASVNAAENQAVVTTVMASDPDAGATLIYSITGGADAARFTINASTGVLSFSIAPDFETPTDSGADNVYDVTVQVSDGLGGTDTQAIAVTVTNVNEAPVITSDGGGATASINAAENQTAVTTVTATDPDGGATLTYSISGGADAALFMIDADTGVLLFNTAPDFETPTDADADNVYDVAVQVSDGLGGTDTQAIAVTVTNVNEAPVITSDGGDATASVNVAENQTTVTTVTAIDPDAGASLTYSITGGADASLFTIDSLTGVLSFGTAPDFETPTDSDSDNVYDVTVEVSDGLGGTDTQAISVTVTNVNEAPAITSDGGAATASVNAAENQTAVTTVAATDPDAGTTLTYSISGGADAALFTIDADTGVLSFNAAPDFETPTDAGADNVYDVTVQVSDGLGGIDTQAIAVTVTNVNEAPAITSDGGGATAGINAAENQTAVTTVTATDPDAGTTLTYSVTGGADAALFTIDADTGVLSFNAAPDFETPTDAGADNVYDVTVEVSDGLGGTDTQAIAVTVTNVNEAPAITSDGGGVTASVNAAENQTAVTTVTATDPDAGASLTYSITGGADASLFSIDPSTGVLSFSTAPDFETPTDSGADNVYNVTVEVTDGLGGIDTQAIAVTVINVNEAPVITSDGGGATVSVNAAENQTAVTTVTATDPDAGATLIYSITGGADASLFSIDPSTGVLSFSTAPDFETPTDSGVDNVYDVTVQVSDGLGGTDTQAIAVTVTNVNEAPTITSDGGGTSASVNAAENQTAVTTVMATDPDAGATLIYSITGGADASLFTIDSSTGVLSFSTAPDFETPTDSDSDNVYDVTVEVSDGLGGTDTQAIAVTVTNVNEAPVITSDGGGAAAGVNATENQTAVTTVMATDPDAGTTLTYSISGGADAALFTIDADTGVLSFNAAPDFETPTDSGNDNVYDVTVEVSDGLGGIDTQAIAVTVTNINEAPVITSGGGGVVASINAAENQTAVTTVTATDPDAGTVLTYSITGGADATLFTIDASTGVLSFNTAPDFETPTDSGSDNVYDVTVQVSDGLGSTDTQAIAVTVTSVNEAPVITSDGGGATASANAAENQIAVTTVTATDPDAGASLTYSISGGADAALFTIDASTGILSFSTAPDFEAPTDSDSDNVYDVTVQVSDGLGGTDTRAIAVTVTNVTEVPAITSDGGGATASVNAAENQTAVTTVTASDPDAGASLTYSISGGADSSLFTIDSSTGVLSFNSAPDLETPIDADADSVYDVTVEVSDGLGGVDTQAISVTVVDVDEFDVGPVTDSDPAGNSVAENATPGTTVGITASATDDDATNNTLTYSLDDDAGGRFAIDGSTGVVSVADGSLIDREAAASHDIVVRVTSSDGSSSTATLTIRVDDIDEFDVGPVSDADARDNRVRPGIAAGAPAGITARAVDADATTNAIVYSLDDDAGGRFAIDPVSGVVTVLDGGRFGVDRVDQYRIVVRATSADGSFSQATFAIEPEAVSGAGPDLPRVPDPGSVSPTMPPLVPGQSPAGEGNSGSAIEELTPDPAIGDRGEEAGGVLPGVGEALPAQADPSLFVSADSTARARRLAGAAFAAADLAGEGPDEALVVPLEPVSTDPQSPSARQPGRDRVIWVDAPSAIAGEPQGPDSGFDGGSDFDATAMSGVALTAGFVWWLTRGGGLLMMVMMGIPAWRHVDLLPIVGRDQDELDDEDDLVGRGGDDGGDSDGDRDPLLAAGPGSDRGPEADDASSGARKRSRTGERGEERGETQADRDPPPLTSEVVAAGEATRLFDRAADDEHTLLGPLQ